jgi:molybdopterin synthase catalytic subunit
MNIEISFVQASITIPPLSLPGREIGACVEFQGIVRELERGTALAGLEYEAYEPMAERELRRILTDLAIDFPCQEVTFIHRLGWVPVGEASMFIRVLASHRSEALKLCSVAIDRLKEDVPIWKVAASRS